MSVEVFVYDREKVKKLLDEALVFDHFSGGLRLCEGALYGVWV